jgi:hypothetical protein
MAMHVATDAPSARQWNLNAPWPALRERGGAINGAFSPEASFRLFIVVLLQKAHVDVDGY